MQTTVPNQIDYPKMCRPAFFNRKTMWVVLMIAGVFWAIWQTNLFRSEVINLGGWALVARFLQAFAQPELSPQFLLLTLNASLTTLAFAIGGVFLSVVFGLMGGILASKTWWTSLSPRRGANSTRSWGMTPWLIVRSGLAIPRAIHEVIWGLFFINVIGLDPMSAILAIAIPFGAITAKVFSEILDETPSDSLTALLNSGASPLKAFMYSLLPRAFADLLSYSFYRFECAIRSAAVLGLIGAGGLGYEIFLSLQTLKYEQIWTLLLALFFLNGLADFWSSSLRGRIGLKAGCAGDCREYSKTIYRENTSPAITDRLVKFSILAGIVLVPFAFVYIRPDVGKIFASSTAAQFRYISSAAWPPEFNILLSQGWWKNIKITISMSLLAVALAGFMAPIFVLYAAKPSTEVKSKLIRGLRFFVYILSRSLLLIARSIPAPIWALLLLFLLFPGIIPGALALATYTLGVLGRLMAEVVENLDNRPIQALKAQGADSIRQLAYGVIPLTFPRFIAYLLVRWEEAIRATVVVGLVGAGGLGRLLIEQLSSFNYGGVVAILLVFVVIIFLVDLISAQARRDFQMTGETLSINNQSLSL